MSNKKVHYFLISESNVGVHSKDKNGNVLPFDVFTMSFFPNVKKGENGIEFHLDSNNDTFQEIVEKYHQLKNDTDIFVLIGFDLDLNGEIMATALKDMLLKKQLPEDRIVRTPLTEQGYVAFKDFVNIDKYKRYLYLQKKFIEKQKKSGLKKTMGFQKAISAELLSKYKGKKTLVDSNISIASGTSTATVVTKFLGGDGEPS